MCSPKEPEALVCDIQRFSVHDGPGIRTVIFFKGCPLACRWCQNPETIGFSNELAHSARECLLCGECVGVCPYSVLSIALGELRIARSQCRLCFTCVERCPTGALSPVATSFDVAALVSEAMRDVHYYANTGGITLSGGEPLIQGPFLRRFLPKAKSRGLHIAAETAGHVPTDQLTALIEHLDLLLFDIKAIDTEQHRRLTGKSNGLILKNLERVIRAECDVEVRFPIIPGHNDDQKNLLRTAELLRSLDMSSVSLLPYHRLGLAKLAKVSTRIVPVDCEPPDPSDVNRVEEIFASRGIETMLVS